MPHFYFHLYRPNGRERDEVGLEFIDLDAAYLDVCRAILDISADLVRSGHDPMPNAFEITDADGSLLMDVPFREMLSKGTKNGQRRPPVSSEMLRAEMVRAKDLCGAVSDSIDRLRQTISITRQTVARSRASGAVDPWGSSPRSTADAS